MKYCTKCGTQVPDMARFCPNCGAGCQEVEESGYTPEYIPQYTPEYTTGYTLEYVPVAPEMQYVYDPAVAQAMDAHNEEQRYLDMCYNILKGERITWKIGSIIYLVSSIIYVFYGLIYLLAGLLSDEDVFEAQLALIAGIAILICTLPMIAGTVVSMIMKAKREKLMNTVHTDLRPMVDTYSRAGCMVLAVMFGGIPAIFTGINMGRIKNSPEIVNNIIAKQQGAMQ